MGLSEAGPFPKVRIGGFVTNAFGNGVAVSPREAELVLRRLHAWNAEGPLARQSTLRKRPNVSARIRTSRKVSRPSDAVANWAESRPRDVSAGRPRSSSRSSRSGRSPCPSSTRIPELGVPFQSNCPRENDVIMMDRLLTRSDESHGKPVRTHHGTRGSHAGGDADLPACTASPGQAGDGESGGISLGVRRAAHTDLPRRLHAPWGCFGPRTSPSTR